MRGLLEGLHSPHPLRTALPALYQEDDLARRFTAGLDDVLAPLLWTLDSLDAYLDPRLAPADFVEWLAGWVGLELDEHWPLQRRRELVSEALELYRWRGTRRGMTQHVALYVGVEPEVEDSGGVVWSAVPGTELPGSPDREVVVRVTVDEPGSVDRERLERLVDDAKPAHVRHRVEVEAA